MKSSRTLQAVVKATGIKPSQLIEMTGIPKEELMSLVKGEKEPSKEQKKLLINSLGIKAPHYVILSLGEEDFIPELGPIVNVIKPEIDSLVIQEMMSKIPSKEDSIGFLYKIVFNPYLFTYNIAYKYNDEVFNLVGDLSIEEATMPTNDNKFVITIQSTYVNCLELVIKLKNVEDDKYVFTEKWKSDGSTLSDNIFIATSERQYEKQRQNIASLIK